MSDTPDDKKPRRDSILILPEERLTADELRSRMAEREAKKQPDSVEYQHSLAVFTKPLEKVNLAQTPV